MRHYILYNPLAGHGDCTEKLAKLESFLSGDFVECDMTKINSYDELISSLEADDDIVISGGDGTLNRFVNSVDCDKLANDVLYYASGSGNDFLHDIGKAPGEAPFKINEYIVHLPTVEVNGRTYRFINGIGYGIDGYCCEVGDKLKAQNKNVNYTSIAIKGLLFHYKPTNATVIVDGESREFKKVWIAPTMNGRFYGGGMMPTPDQQRLGSDEASVMVFHGTGKLKTLMIFPSLFKGEHVKHTEAVSIFKGKDVTVKFDKPTALQIDGETVLGVTEYTVHSRAAVKA